MAFPLIWVLVTGIRLFSVVCSSGWRAFNNFCSWEGVFQLYSVVMCGIGLYGGLGVANMEID